jgi:hypothetical protein
MYTVIIFVKMADYSDKPSSGLIGFFQAQKAVRGQRTLTEKNAL